MAVDPRPSRSKSPPQIQSFAGTILASLMSLTTTLGWWGVSTWVPHYVADVAAKSGGDPSAWARGAGMINNVGAIAGYIGFGFMADRFGRRPATMVYFTASLIVIPVLFYGPKICG